MHFYVNLYLKHLNEACNTKKNNKKKNMKIMVAKR